MLWFYAMILSILKTGSKNAWVTIGDGVVGVTKSGRNDADVPKPRGFSLPETLLDGEGNIEDGGALADFVASSLARCGVERGGVGLLLGTGAAFYEEYKVNPDASNLRAVQRNIAIDRALGDEAPSYIIEDVKLGVSDGLMTCAVYGARYDFLEKLAKGLKKHGYLVVYASYASLANPGQSDPSLPDLTYGGRENRRFGRVTAVLCACAVAVAAFVVLLPPVQAARAEAETSRYIANVSGDNERYYEMLQKSRDLQKRLEEVREEDILIEQSLKPDYLLSSVNEEKRPLAGYKTGYGELLAYLNANLLNDGVVGAIALEDADGLVVEYTTTNPEAFVEKARLVNESRRMSVSEKGTRVNVEEGGAEAWRLTVQVAYYSFDDEGGAF
ncbi:MAG: hypothetical protein LBS67_04440 [Clostridiales Family XIII bacterium]|jgi:hypothetical protein|nr:hypothetical protein [Clostridiales Family XIII bacterium]